MPNYDTMLYILYTKLSGRLPDSLYNTYLSGLPADMQQVNGKYVRWQDGLRHLLGKKLLAEALGKFGLDQNALHQTRYNDYGRPCLEEKTGIDFNISHSGNYVVCAASKTFRVGIDIEEIKPVIFDDFNSVMTDDQWKVIKTAHHPLKAFFTFWTIKESIIKADSRGLSIPLSDIRIENNKAHYDGQTWYLYRLDIDTNYCSYLAVNANIISCKIEYRDYYYPPNPLKN